ncbi:helix-turn-helix domain-containing protein [Demequina sp.]|uniref:helix-turn-helix domain-containing protein n=1 Tax=Demequina sp. TaxID=2050685 RepID=UPI003A83D345
MSCRGATVVRLSAATGIPSGVLRRRIANPEKLTLPELARIATALHVRPSELLGAQVPAVTS